MIQINNLSKTYSQGEEKVVAIDDINLKIEKGDIYGIIGPSGAGKSSLIRCLNLLETPDTGSILINGEDITKLNIHELREKRKKIGMIFQHFNLMNNATVGKNISFPLEISNKSKGKIEERLKELLDMVSLEDKRDFYPAKLSGGQKQRVGIARALANEPSLLLCDEATSALDPVTTKSILELLKEINSKFNLTIVLITHEMEVIKQICNKVSVIEQGKIIETGLTKEVLANPQSSTLKEFLNS